MAKKNYLGTKPPKKVFRQSKVNQHPKLKPTKKLPDFEYLETNKVTNCQKTDSNRAYKFYKNSSKQKIKLGKDSFQRIFKLFLKELRLQMLNNERGVFIENFGYFGIIKSPIKTRTEKTPISQKGLEATGERYKPIFLPIRKVNSLGCFTLDKGFHESLNRGIAYRLKKGKDYKFCYTLLHNLYGRENNKINPPIEK